MVKSDKERIEKINYELNYILNKFDKRQTIDNRNILSTFVDKFKDNYKEDKSEFYKQLEKSKEFKKFEDK